MSGGASLSSLAASLHLESLRSSGLESRMRIVGLYMQEAFTRLNKILWDNSSDSGNPIRDTKIALRDINLGRVVALAKELNDQAEAKIDAFETEGIPTLVDSLVLFEEILYPSMALETAKLPESGVRMADSLLGLPAAKFLGIKGNPLTTSTNLQPTTNNYLALHVPPAILDNPQIQGGNLSPGQYSVQPVNKKYKGFSVVRDGNKPDLAADYTLPPVDGVLNNFFFLRQDLHLLLTSSDKPAALQAFSSQKTQKLLVVSPNTLGQEISYQKHFETDITQPQSDTYLYKALVKTYPGCSLVAFRPTPSSLQLYDFELDKVLLDIPELSCKGTVRHFALTHYETEKSATILFDVVQENEVLSVYSGKVSLELKGSTTEPKRQLELKPIQSYKQNPKSKELTVAMTSLRINMKPGKTSYLGIIARVLAENADKGGGIKIYPTISFWDGQHHYETLATSSAGSREDISFKLQQDLNSLEHLGLGVQVESFFIEPTAKNSSGSLEFVVALFISVESKLIVFKYSLPDRQSSLNVSKAALNHPPLVIKEVFGASYTSGIESCKYDTMQQTPEGLQFFSALTGKTVHMPFTKKN